MGHDVAKAKKKQFAFTTYAFKLFGWNCLLYFEMSVFRWYFSDIIPQY